MVSICMYPQLCGIHERMVTSGTLLVFGYRSVRHIGNHIGNIWFINYHNHHHIKLCHLHRLPLRMRGVGLIPTVHHWGTSRSTQH